ncbi:hypothetical protein GCM10027421_27790 [Microbacterium shaanxiense]
MIGMVVMPVRSVFGRSLRVRVVLVRSRLMLGMLPYDVRVIVVVCVRHDLILPKGSISHNRIPLGGIPERGTCTKKGPSLPTRALLVIGVANGA